MKYRAFISYRHSSSGRMHAVALETALKRYAKPLLKPPPKIFRDEKHMVPNNDLTAVIKKGLEESEYLIFIADASSAQSPWCQDELAYWCDELGRSEQLIIVHIQDDLVMDLKSKTVDWEKTNALPSLLQKHIPSIPFYEELSWPAKPEDLDLQNIRYKTSINRITARLRGKTPEELNDEEVLIFRRNRRLRNGTILALSILLTISMGTTWWALNQTQIATKQTLYALAQEEIARDSAQSAREQREIAQDNSRMARDNAADARRQEKLAEYRRQLAEVAQKEAEYQAALAEIQRDSANLERDRARYEAQVAYVNGLASNAMSMKEIDPTKALRIAERAYRQSKPPFPLASQALVAAMLEFSENAMIPYASNFSNADLNILSVEGFSPNETYAFCQTDDGPYVFDMLGRKPLAKLDHGGDLGFSSSGRFFVRKTDEQLTVWNQELERIISYSTDGDDIASYAIAPDDSFLLIRTKKGLLVNYSFKNREFRKISEKTFSEPLISPNSQFILATATTGEVLLWDANGQLILSEKAHIQTVNEMGFSPDSRYFYTQTLRDSTVKLWNIQRRKYHELGHKFGVYDLLFSPDSRYLATKELDHLLLDDDLIWAFNRICLWNMDGSIHRILEVDDLIQSFLFASKDRLLITLSNPKGVGEIFDFPPDVLAKNYLALEAGASSAAQARNGKLLLKELLGNAQYENSNEGTLLVFSTTKDSFIINKEFLCKSPIKSNAITSPDGALILGLKSENQALLINKKGQEITQNIRHNSPINSAHFSPDNQLILTTSIDGTGKIWTKEGELKASIYDPVGGISSAVFTRGGNYVISNGYNQQTKLWGLRQEMPVAGGLVSPHNRYMATSVEDIEVGPNSRRLVVFEDSDAMLWDDQGQFLAKLSLHQQDTNHFYTFTAAFMPRSGALLSLGYYHSPITDAPISFFYTWNAAGQLEEKIPVLLPDAPLLDISPEGGFLTLRSYKEEFKELLMLNQDFSIQYRSADIAHSEFSSDGSTLLLVEDGTLKKDAIAYLLDPISRDTLCLLNQGPDRHTSPLRTGRISSNGSTVLTFAGSNTVKLWRANGSFLANLTLDTPIHNFLFCPGNKEIVMAYSRSGEARLWDIQGKEVYTFTQPVFWARFSPEGDHFITLNRQGDTQLTVWETKGLDNHVIGGHADTIRQVLWSPDSRFFATTSGSPNFFGESQEFFTAKVWNCEGELVGDYPIHDGEVSTMAFSNDGNTLFTGTKRGKLYFLPTAEKVLKWLDKDPVPSLSRPELRQIGIGDHPEIQD